MLDEILAAKRIELAEKMSAVSLEQVLTEVGEEAAPPFSRRLDRPEINIIAEIKYRSPSRGNFGCRLTPADVGRGYAAAGAAAISVLTDKAFFNGTLENLKAVRRELPDMPLLRKDFIIDRYQIAEARAAGASACLLIVAALTEAKLNALIRQTAEDRMEALVEVHAPRELESAINGGARLIGVNNRNLRTFEVNLATSFELARRMEGESGFRLVSESGLKDPSAILELKDAGYCGFLIGSALMESGSPGAKLEELLAACRERA